MSPGSFVLSRAPSHIGARRYVSTSSLLSLRLSPRQHWPRSSPISVGASTSVPKNSTSASSSNSPRRCTVLPLFRDCVGGGRLRPSPWERVRVRGFDVKTLAGLRASQGDQIGYGGQSCPHG